MSQDGDFEVITLRNGQRAVRHTGHGEVMHPSVGPWREANLLYVEQPKLAERLMEPSSQPLRILDVGLGAAANAVAALSCARALGERNRRPLELVSFEVDLAPLRLALSDEAGFPFLAPWQEAAATLMAQGRYQEEGLLWRLEVGEFLSRLPGNRDADLVYFDPFSPEKNPALWTRHALSQVRAACREQTCQLITYSASTRTRASLLLAGFFVGAGVAIGTKSQTTIASTGLSCLASPLGAEWIGRWKRSSARAPHGEELTPELEKAIEAHPQFR